MPRVVVLSGAGISAESDLKTFRGDDGLWERHPVEDVACPEAWARGLAVFRGSTTSEGGLSEQADGRRCWMCIEAARPASDKAARDFAAECPGYLSKSFKIMRE